YEHGGFGVPASTVTNFANTLYAVIYDPAKKSFHMRVDGTDGAKAARQSVAASWMLLSEYFPNPDLYHIAAGASLTHAKTRPLETAFILWMKNRRYPAKRG